ncbi:hypothetical protein [Litoribacter populi]|uniref:hypothetical protein n=1 Tax=Litoribacter populi TaxID=2598460 RepID=UPI0011802228|nr:hypothetical protein [Litoribacter populi]
MATGAFPLGLRPRQVSRSSSFISDNAWNHLLNIIYTPKNDPYSSYFVDGGLINNEPFERVLDILNGNKNDESIENFKSALLMIDPFPSAETRYEDHVDEPDLSDLFFRTFSAMTGQLQVKPHLVEKAFNINNGSHFLISPKRSLEYVKDGVKQKEPLYGKYAIAGGALGGFSGFIHKEFRVHDFFLGRANCKRFLRKHFTVPLDKNHKIINYGYHHLTEARKNYFIKTNQDHKQAVQIIPIFDEEVNNDFYMPKFNNGTKWPFRQSEEIFKYKKPIRKRVDKLIMNVADLNFKDNLLLWAGKQVFLRKKLTKLTIDFIEDSLEDHKLLPTDNINLKP